MRPAGLLERNGALVRDGALVMEGTVTGADGMGLTVEPSGGSPQPTSCPLMFMNLAAS